MQYVLVKNKQIKKKLYVYFFLISLKALPFSHQYECTGGHVNEISDKIPIYIIHKRKIFLWYECGGRYRMEISKKVFCYRPHWRKVSGWFEGKESYLNQIAQKMLCYTVESC